LRCDKHHGGKRKEKMEYGNYSLETRPFFPYNQEVRVFKYTGFNRFADKEDITDNELLEIADQLEALLRKGTLTEITKED
jgi:hypothetical protein